MKTYAVTAERDGKFWFIRIPELDGVTQARTDAEISVMARDYIAVTLDVPADSFDLKITRLPQDGDRNYSN
ncbi:hypothetical protein [Microbacterium sp. KSW4-4]|uniref:hypothetical protein n=1 Tax=Microbacterium sp. KSW4-4 TaxID=2851651 RepID=UPI001FFD81B0|nr:hypothetical protein [Microbacterium sp. KSW4-4]MCK2031776.1 hypothetical protein [Microbacterium sp. KSW4-4]